jgi:hypothetical protein
VLVRVLETIAQGGTYSFADLARTVGVERELLDQMIEHLTRMGYLKPVGGVCHSGCDDCLVAGVCGIGGECKAWSLTGKGSQLLKKMRQPRVHAAGRMEAREAQGPRR